MAVSAGARGGRRRDGVVMQLELRMLVRWRAAEALAAGADGGRTRDGATKLQLRMPVSQCMGTVV